MAYEVEIRPVAGDMATPTPDAPLPTVAPTATATPSVTPTLVPYVTDTPTPADPTPTPEATAPPITPRPTLPPPDEEVCMFGVNTTVLNVRAEPNVTATVLRQLARNTRHEVVALYIRFAEGSPNRQEWGQLADGGWAALWYGGSQLGVLDDTPPCWEIPIEYVAVPPPSGGGFHVLSGPGSGDVVQYADQIEVIKCLNNSWHICAAVKAENPNVITIARTLTTNYGQIDGPQAWNWTEPGTWWAAIRDHLPAGFDYYEVINEQWFPPQGAAHLAWWSIEIAKLIERDKGGALLAFSFSAGSPGYPDWPALVPYMVWADQNPLKNGSRHGIALHGAAYAPWRRADSPWIGNSHLDPDRFYVYAQAVILANAKIDTNLLRIPVIWTEIGVTDGYATGVIGGPERYSCNEKASAYRETKRKLVEYGGAFTWWTIATGGGPWTSDHDCLSQMLQ